MNATKPTHTPGPWTLREDQPFTFRIIGPETKDGLAICGNIQDARLISASPDLLMCLESFFANWPEFDETHADFDKPVNGADLVDWFNDQAPYWKEALKKARGESSPTEGGE
jgi:hypothetical protein